MSMPVIDNLMKNWDSLGTYTYAFEHWTFEEQMACIYRATRYVVSVINNKNFEQCFERNDRIENGVSGFSEWFCGDDRLYTWLKPHTNREAVLGSLGKKFQVDFCKHAIVSTPWNKKKALHYGLLTAISKPQHDFYDPIPGEEIRVDLILPWGLFVVSVEGNHRSMGCILSGVGSINKKHISDVHDFGQVRAIAEKSMGLTKEANALWDISRLIEQTQKRFNRTPDDISWLDSY